MQVFLGRLIRMSCYFKVLFNKMLSMMVLRILLVVGLVRKTMLSYMILVDV